MVVMVVNASKLQQRVNDTGECSIGIPSLFTAGLGKK